MLGIDVGIMAAGIIYSRKEISVGGVSMYIELKMYLRKLKALIFLMMSALEWNLERYMVSGEEWKW